jgi:beta-lactamase superfamily II metal-dependent hydrolase
VLQLPEHGTIRSLSERFLEAVSPQVVILQSDPANRNGDPDPDTMALLGDLPIFRTDQGGAIHMWTDGEDLWVEQAKKR